MSFGPLFDAQRGEDLKHAGMAAAAEADGAALIVAREIAERLATENTNREITADEVQAVLIMRGYQPLGASAGSLFKGKKWEFTGRWQASARTTNHKRQNRVWRLTV
jgi:hypothetical protein